MSKKTIITLVVIIVAAVGFSLFRIFQDVPFSGPKKSLKLKEPITIGIVHHRQQNEIIEAMKINLQDIGYENVTYEQILISPGPTADQDNINAVKEFIEKDVDLIYTPLEVQAKVAVSVTKEMNSDIPIVFNSLFHDPTKYGLAESFVSSNNNASGVVLDTVSILQKMLEFTREIDPSIKNIGVFSDGFILPPIGSEFFEELKIQAGRLGYNVVEYKTTLPPPQAEAEFKRIAGTIKSGDIDAIYHVPGHFYDIQEVEEGKLAKRLGILHIAPIEDLPNGGHFGYSGEYVGTGKQNADIIDKILRGTKPADIPLEFVKKLILVLYTKRAGEAGIIFPESMLFLADEIEE